MAVQMVLLVAVHLGPLVARVPGTQMAVCVADPDQEVLHLRVIHLKSPGKVGLRQEGLSLLHHFSMKVTKEV